MNNPEASPPFIEDKEESASILVRDALSVMRKEVPRSPFNSVRDSSPFRLGREALLTMNRLPRREVINLNPAMLVRDGLFLISSLKVPIEDSDEKPSKLPSVSLFTITNAPPT